MKNVWSPGMKLEDVERLVIEQAFSFYKQNKTKTAEALGIAVRTLDTKLGDIERLKNEATKTHAKTGKTGNSHIQGGLRGAFYPYAEGHKVDPTRLMQADVVGNDPATAFGEKPKPQGEKQEVRITHAPKKEK